MEDIKKTVKKHVEERKRFVLVQRVLYSQADRDVIKECKETLQTALDLFNVSPLADKIAWNSNQLSSRCKVTLKCDKELITQIKSSTTWLKTAPVGAVAQALPQSNNIPGEMPTLIPKTIASVLLELEIASTSQKVLPHPRIINRGRTINLLEIVFPIPVMFSCISTWISIPL